MVNIRVFEDHEIDIYFESRKFLDKNQIGKTQDMTKLNYDFVKQLGSDTAYFKGHYIGWRVANGILTVIGAV